MLNFQCCCTSGLDILVITKAATDKVQGPCLNISISSRLIETCVKQFSTMRENEDHFNETLERRVSEAMILMKAFSDETTVDQPLSDAKTRFKVEVYNLVLGRIVTDLNTRFNDTTVGVSHFNVCYHLQPLMKDKDSPSHKNLDELKVLCDFYVKYLPSFDVVHQEYCVVEYLGFC